MKRYAPRPAIPDRRQAFQQSRSAAKATVGAPGPDLKPKLKPAGSNESAFDTVARMVQAQRNR